MRQFEIGLLIGPPIAWKPELERYDGKYFSGLSLTWLFVALILRIYVEDAPSVEKVVAAK